MKKITSLFLSLIMIATIFCACGDKKDQTDLEYIKEKGTLVVGITDFAPMDYQDKDGKWIGFDADLAKAFGEYLGVDVEFSLITWSNKIMELDGRTIDCAWNGMTLSSDVLAAMECSNAYCKNAQVVIVPADKADQYQTAESCKDLKFAVEAGSAGRDVAKENGFKYIEVIDQATALQEVAAGTSDAAIVDWLMAGAMIGEGTGYANLTYTVELNDEEYGVGFRKGSNLAGELNKFLKQSYDDGTLMNIAQKYNIADHIIAQ